MHRKSIIHTSKTRKNYSNLFLRAICGATITDPDCVSAGLAVVNQIKRNKLGLFVGAILLIMLSLTTYPMPYITGYVIDSVIPQKNANQLLTIVLLLAAIALLQAILSYACGMIFFVINGKIIISIREKLFRAITSMSYEKLCTLNTGYMMSRLQDDPPKLALIFGDSIINLATNCITVVAGISILFYLNVRLAVVAIIFIALLTMVMRHYGILLRHTMKDVFEKNAKTVQSLQENIDISEIAVRFRRNLFPVHRYLHSMLSTFRAFVALEKIENTSTSVIGFISGALPLSMLLLGGLSIMHGVFSIGQFVTFMGILTIIIGPVASIVGFNIEIQKVRVGLKRVGEILNETPEEDYSKYPALTIEDEIEFQNISYTYIENKQVLNSVTISAKYNRLTVIAGPSGSGKTTLAKLISGLRGEAMEVSVDRLSAVCLPQGQLRNNVSYLEQDPMFIEGTIKENIRLAYADANDAEIKYALQQAQAWTFVVEKKGGMDFMLSQNASELSAGERQRLALARALITQPMFLIVDESIANVDTSSETLIYHALRDLSKKVMILVITHRLNALAANDYVYWLENGKIEFHGEHSMLLSIEKKYRYYCNTAEDKAMSIR